MGEATLNGVPFRVDPSAISWPFAVKTKAIKTIGGKVVQVFGTSVGDLTVSGTFGKGGRQEQLAFLDRMKKLGDDQMDRFPLVSPKPYRFIWPSRGWDCKVWLRSYSEPGSESSVDERTDNVSPRWQLTLFVASDNLDLKKVAADSFLARLAEGIGWKETRYNGPLDFAAVEEALGQMGVTNVRDYLGVAFGIFDSVPVGNTNADGSTGATATGPPTNRTSFDLVVWARDFLSALGKPQTTENLAGIVAWELMEGGHTNGATWNPLNTTLWYNDQNVPMNGNFGQNGGHPVQAYPSYAIGLERTVTTITSGRYGYPSILSALDAGTSAEAIAEAVGNTGWGTKNGILSVIPRARRMVTG